MEEGIKIDPETSETGETGRVEYSVIYINRA